MSKLPAVKDRGLMRTLKRLGFVERPERGTSHLVFSHPDGRMTTVSRHPGRDIPKGTLRATLRDIDVTPEEFKRIL